MHFLFFSILIFLSSLIRQHPQPCFKVYALPTTPPPPPVDNQALHFTLARRGGTFAASCTTPDGLANFTFLEEELERVQQRFSLTRREVVGNKLVRKVKEKVVKDKVWGGLIGLESMGRNGGWYAKIKIGEPPQEIEMDLDMLSSDFFIVTTTSARGSRYEDTLSQTKLQSESHPSPHCDLPTDIFHLPLVNASIPIDFAHCKPSKASINTLDPSGSVFGLAPSTYLSQISSPTVLTQLAEQGIISRPIISLMLINSQEGVFSIGGTMASTVHRIERETKEKLDRATTSSTNFNTTLQHRDLDDAIDVEGSLSSSNGNDQDWRDSFCWTPLLGAFGFHQVLLQGIYINNEKILKSFPIILDINTPLVLAPPLAARTFYASISGALPLDWNSDLDRERSGGISARGRGRTPRTPFWKFPCLNPPILHFEFDGFPFSVMHGLGGLGGRFSLGRVREGSGYCVGAVVEWGGDDDSEDGEGLGGVWILGEGFFREVGAVFDYGSEKVGFWAL